MSWCVDITDSDQSLAWNLQFSYVRLVLLTLRFVTVHSVHFSYVYFLISFRYVLLRCVWFGSVLFRLITLCSIRFGYVSFLLSFLMFCYVGLCVVRFCFI
jgi:hypothetical protein